MAYNQLKWESEWIMNHPERYEGQYHQKAVIQNIKKRFIIHELKKELERNKKPLKEV